MKTVKKSFYALEVFVSPGGSRKSEVHVRDNFAEIKQALEDEVSISDNIYLLVWYGEDVNLLVYQNSAEVQKIPLLPHIRIKIKGYPEIWFDNANQMRGVKFRGQDYRKDWTENPSRIISDEVFIGKMFERDWKFSATVGWNSVKVEPLAGDAAKAGDHLIIVSNYTKEK